MKKNILFRIMRRLVIISNRYVFRAMDYLFPKDSQLVIFSLKFGRYSDNSRALYEYMTKNSSFTAVWLAENVDTFENIKSSFPKGKVVLRYSFQGLMISLKSKYYIVSYSSLDNGYFSYMSKRTKIIMLWHAITLKYFGVLDNKLDSNRIKKFVKNETSKYDLHISSSDIDRHTISLCQGINARKVIVTGLPRNDKLIQMFLSNNQDADGLSISPKILEKNIILYAPTFRDNKVTKFFPFEDFDVDILVEVLEKLNAYLLIRPHQNDFKNQEKIKTIVGISSGHILLAGNNEVPNVNDLLPFVDVIVTDYSSIYIDLLLNDVPPIFLPYDLEEYEKVRGLAYDYELVTPGPKALTQKEFLASIEDALNGAVEYRDKRFFVKKMFHKYEDGKSCERIIKTMEEIY